VGLSKSITFGLHAETADNGDTLLLTAGKLARIFFGLFCNFDFLKIIHCCFFGFGFWDFPDPGRPQRQVLKDGQVWKEVKMLKNYTDFRSYFFYILKIFCKLNTIDAFLVTRPDLYVVVTKNLINNVKAVMGLSQIQLLSKKRLINDPTFF